MTITKKHNVKSAKRYYRYMEFSKNYAKKERIPACCIVIEYTPFKAKDIFRHLQLAKIAPPLYVDYTDFIAIQVR